MSKSVDSGWVLTWKMVDDVNHVLARPVAGVLGLPILGLSLGLVVQSGCASLRSLHLQVISRSALKNGGYGALISKAVFFSGPSCGESLGSRCFCGSNALAFGPIDASVLNIF